MVMELLRYPATIVKEHKQSPQQKLAMMLGAARGLEYIHYEKRFAHGDVKLANMLISEAGIVKIADLTSAVNISCQAEVARQELLQRVYTATHVAPEVLLLGEMSEAMMAKVDVFAFGVTMLEIMQAPAKLHHRAANSLALPRIDPKLFVGFKPIQQLVKRCLSDNPEERPNMHKIVRKIERLCPDDTISVLPSSLLCPGSSHHHSGGSVTATQKTNTNAYTCDK
eukprot:TRINITY_DN1298_c0_g1_i13.p1 TRINITY_DN1298_c0_g1~~TRINITY_DN1298_c0_g1_i13.p1  ORF type:complete len:225 (+),score=42.00 TRINITY_DN1298_c0_g1_i13:246-920(+)